MPVHSEKPKKKLPKTLRIVEPKNLKEKEAKPKKKVPRTLRIKEPEKPTKKMPKTLRIVNPVKPTWLISQSKEKFYIAFDKSTGKQFNPDTYLTADDKKILGTIYNFLGFNPEAYVTSEAEGSASRKFNKEIIDAKPRISRIYNQMIKNLVVYEGKMVLDKSSKTTKVSIKFPEPIGTLKIPPKQVRTFKKMGVGSDVNGFDIKPSLEQMFRHIELANDQKKNSRGYGESPKKYNTKSL
jgi:hypothetical protein